MVGEGSDTEVGSQVGKCISQDGPSDATVTMLHVWQLSSTSSPLKNMGGWSGCIWNIIGLMAETKRIMETHMQILNSSA